MKTFETEKNNIPEGATHYCDKCGIMRFVWLKEIDGIMMLWIPGKSTCWNEVKHFYSYYMEEMKPIPKPETTKWNGEGLPPVGSKIMCSYTDADCDGWCDMHGPSDVIAYHGDYVWIAHHGKFHRVHELCNVEFEKPESPEEKEKREAVQKAMDFLAEDDHGGEAYYYKGWFEALYDEGMLTNYRKGE